MVQKFTKIGKSEVTCKAHSHVGIGRACTVHAVGVRGNTHDKCEKYYFVDKKKDRQTGKSHRSG